MGEKILFPNYTIIKTDNFDIHQDWEIPIPGFYIMASIRPIRSVMEMNEVETNEFMKLLTITRKGMKEVLAIEDVYLFQNEDTKHHFHLWLFPRLEWMEKFGRKIESVRPIIDYAKANLVNHDTFQQVKDATELMKNYIAKAI